MNARENLIPGLVSITFRSLAPDDIIALAAANGLRSIEWGADAHVKVGDLEFARRVGDRTREAGLIVSSYGSYYRAGHDGATFESILKTAVAMGAPRIRIWAGQQDAGVADAAYRAAVTRDVRRVTELARRAGLRVALEFHGGTLTSSADSAAALLNDLRDVHLESYWQPRVDATPDEALADLRLLAPWIQHAHVFAWWPALERHPLADGAERWTRYLTALAALARPIHVQLEYVKDNRPEQLPPDAATLLRLIQSISA